MPELPEKPPFDPPKEPPRLLGRIGDIVLFFVCGMIGVFAYKAYLNGNWIVFWFNIALILLNTASTAIRWRSNRKMWKIYETLKEIHKIMNMPTFQEVGNSIIITAVHPSPELLKELDEIHKQLNIKINGKNH